MIKYLIKNTKNRKYYGPKDSWEEDIHRAKTYLTEAAAKGVLGNLAGYHKCFYSWDKSSKYPPPEDLKVIPVEYSVKEI